MGPLAPCHEPLLGHGKGISTPFPSKSKLSSTHTHKLSPPLIKVTKSFTSQSISVRLIMHIGAEIGNFYLHSLDAGYPPQICVAITFSVPPTSCQNGCLPLENEQSSLKCSHVFCALAERIEYTVLVSKERLGWSSWPYPIPTKALAPLQLGNSCLSSQDLPAQGWDPGTSGFFQFPPHLSAWNRPPQGSPLPCL